MANKPLYSSSSINLYWLAAGRFYCKQGHLDTEKITEKYFNIWPIEDVAKVLIATAQDSNWRIIPEINKLKLKVDIYKIENYDSSTLKTIFEDIFPILEGVLTVQEGEEEFDNQIDPVRLRNHLLNQALIENQFQAAIKAVQRGDPPILVNQAFRSAKDTIAATLRANTIEETISGLTTHPSTSPLTAYALAANLPPSIAEYARKIAGLDGGAREQGLLDYRDLLAAALDQSQQQLAADLAYAQKTLSEANQPIPITTDKRPLIDWIQKNVPGLSVVTAETFTQQLISLYQQPISEPRVLGTLTNTDTDTAEMVAGNFIKEAINTVESSGGSLPPETIPGLVGETVRVIKSNQPDWPNTIAQRVIDLSTDTPTEFPRQLVDRLRKITLSDALSPELTTGQKTPTITIPAIDIARAVTSFEAAAQDNLATAQRLSSERTLRFTQALAEQGNLIPVSTDPKILTEWVKENGPDLPDTAVVAIASRLADLYQQPVADSPLTADPTITPLIVSNLIGTATGNIEATGGTIPPEVIPELLDKTSNLVAKNQPGWVAEVAQLISNSVTGLPDSTRKEFPQQLVDAFEKVTAGEVLSPKDTKVSEPVPLAYIQAANIANIITSTIPEAGVSTQAITEETAKQVARIIAGFAESGIAVPVLTDVSEARKWVDKTIPPTHDDQTKNLVAATIVNVFNQPLASLQPARISRDTLKFVTSEAASQVARITSDRIVLDAKTVEQANKTITDGPDWVNKYADAISLAVDLNAADRLSLSRQIAAKLSETTLAQTLATANHPAITGGVLLTTTQIAQGVTGLQIATAAKRETAEKISAIIVPLEEKGFHLPITTNPQIVQEWFNTVASGTSKPDQLLVAETVTGFFSQPAVMSLDQPTVVEKLSERLSSVIDSSIGLHESTLTPQQLTQNIVSQLRTGNYTPEQISQTIVSLLPNLPEKSRTSLAESINQTLSASTAQILTGETDIVGQLPSAVGLPVIVAATEMAQTQLSEFSIKALPDNLTVVLVEAVSTPRDFTDVLAQSLTSQPIELSDLNKLINTLAGKPEFKDLTTIIIANPEEYTRRISELQMVLLEAIDESGISLTPKQIGQLTTKLIPKLPASSIPLTPQSITSLPPILLPEPKTHRVSPLVSRVVADLPQTPFDKSRFDSLDSEQKVSIIIELRARLTARANEIYHNQVELEQIELEFNKIFNPTFALVTVINISENLTLAPKTRPPLIEISVAGEKLSEQLVVEKVTSLPDIPPSLHVFLATLPGQKPNTTALDDYRTILITEGTTPLARTKLDTIKARAQAVWLLDHGITLHDLRAAQLKLLGDVKNASTIEEISRILKQLQEIESGASVELKKYIEERRKFRISEQQKNAPSVQIPFSKIKTFIFEKPSPNLNLLTNKADTFLRKYFGEKTIQLTNGRSYSINRIKFINYEYNKLRQRFARYLGQQFAKTSVGRSFNYVMVRFREIGTRLLIRHGSSIIKVREMWVVGRQVLSKTGTQLVLRTAIKLGLGGLFRAGASSAAGTAAGTAGAAVGTTAGAATGAVAGTAVAPVVGTAIGFLGGLLIKPILSFGKRTILSPLTLFNSLLTGTGGERLGAPEMSLLLIIILVIGGSSILSLVSLGSLAGAFTLQGKGSAIPGGIEQPLQDKTCKTNRHFSEEVICKISERPNPCDKSLIKTSTWFYVNNCINQTTDFTHDKEPVRSNFEASVQSYINLQCVGFVQGIQSALGHPLEAKGDAKNYTSGSINYHPVFDPENGDLAVWSWGQYGHIAIIISIETNRIIVAEANGYNGKVSLVAYPFSKLGSGNGNPDVLLRAD